MTPPAAHAATPLRYDVDAVVTEDGVVTATVRVDVRREPGEPLRFWWLAERVSEAPDGLDEQSWRWFYPGEADLGRASFDGISVDGVDQPIVSAPVAGSSALSGTDVLLEAPGSGRTAEVTLRVRLALPGRFGRFGRDGATVVLLGPWYPLLVGPGGAHRFEVPHRVRVRGPRGRSVLVDGRVRPLPAEAVVVGPYAPMMIARRLEARRVRVDGTELTVVSPEGFYDPPAPGARGLEALDDLLAIDRVGRIAEAWQGAPETLRAVGLAAPEAMTVVVFPSRTELASTAPGLVLVSDRSFEIFPIDGFVGFHTRALREAMLRHAIEPAVDAIEPPGDRAWVADLRARVLADLDLARRKDDAKSPRELLAVAAFHPIVDNLLYARQVPFLDVYFEAGTAPSRFREDPDQARAPRPKPRRLLENARLVVPPAAYAGFLAGVAAGAGPTRALLAAASPAAADAIDDWLAPCPVNYRLGEVRSERVGGGWRHRVEVLRDGRTACDVVEVLVRDRDGHEARGIWRDSGSRGEVVVETPAALDRVVVDPAGRIVQDPDLADGHPRADDASSWPFRPPILEAFGVSASFADRQWQAFLTFSLKRQYDLENIWLFSLFRDPGRVGGALRYLRGVGPKRHGNARVGVVGLGVDLARLDAGFAGAEQGGLRFGLNAQAGLDTRRYRVDPRSGITLLASGRAGGVYRDSGELVWNAAVSARAGGVVSLGNRHAVLLVGSGGWTFGQALQTELQRIGGVSGLRGYQVGEVVGDGAFDVVAEYRFTALTDLAMNLFHLAWLREVQLVLFGGAGVLVGPEESDADVFGLADVGAGIRLHVDYAGVQPGVVAFDVAWPITASPTRQGLVGGGAPVPGFYLYFSQYL